LASLAMELGYDAHLLFNRNDEFHIVEYLRTRLQIGEDHVHEWSYINEASSQFDVILLNTSCVWLDYGFRLQQWNASQRLIVVHHLPEDIELNPYGASLYLTPAVDKAKWIFPLYGNPSAPAELAAEEAAGAAHLPTLITIGWLELKNIADVSAYMQAGGSVVHYDRHPCHHFPDQGHYQQHVGLNGKDFMGSLGEQKQPMFLWFPILPESHYLVFRFCGALILGVDMKCVMVMPEGLRKLYEFPEDAVISYQTSVTEGECVRKLREPSSKQMERRRSLSGWAQRRWQENLKVFEGALGSRNA
jgi:hypothetical protein